MRTTKVIKTKETTRATATKNKLTLTELIDKLGTLNDKRKELETEEKKLKEKINELVEEGKLELGNKYKGNNYEMSVSEVTTQVYDPAIVYAKLKDKNKFLDTVSVVATKLKQVMLPADMEECVSEVKSYNKINIKKM
jgi:predicted transcriptional regulator